jgi:hypothetical protein
MSILRLNKVAATMAEAEKRQFRETDLGPGLPERHTTLPPKITTPQVWEFSAHPHLAKRSGDHIDIRLGDRATGIAHSFVIPKTKELPAPGESARVIPTYDHRIEYMDYTGPISSRYGRGTVIPGRRTQTEVYHSEPDDAPGTKLRFNLYDQAAPEEFALRKDLKGGWFLHNKTQTRAKRPDIPTFKPDYKEIGVDDVDPTDDQQAMMPKLDGASAIIDLKAGRAPRVYSYREGKVSKTGLIEHTHKMTDLLKTKVPKELDGTMLRAEIVGVDKDGAAIPAEAISGLLNSRVWESRRQQEATGVKLKLFPFSVVRHKGKNLEDAPFDTKLEVLERVRKALPAVQLPDLAVTPEEKIDLLNRVKAKQYPLTQEGVVLVNRSEPGVPVKAKFAPDFDVFVRDIHAAKKKGGGEHDRAGSISYSWTPDGPVVGQLGGFDHDTARDMLANPDKYKGMVAKVKATKVFQKGDDMGALFQPRFQEWHLDKGDIEKASMLHSFFAELTKIAAEPGMFGQATDWAGEHPLATAGIAGGLAATGMGGRHLYKMLRPNLTATRASTKKMQQLARSEGIGFAVPSKGTSVDYVPSLLERVKARIATRGQTPIYTVGSGAQQGQVLSYSKDPAKRMLTVGLDPTVNVGSKGEVLYGGAGSRSRTAKQTAKAMLDMEHGGKVMEMSKEVGLQKLFPAGASVQEIVKKYGLKMPGKSMESRMQFLDELQVAMKKEYGKPGYIMKPHGDVASGGYLPTSSDKWSKRLRQYESNLKPKMEAARKEFEAHPEKYPGKAWENVKADLFREHPAYIAGAMEQAATNPAKVLVQQKMPLLKTRAGYPVEYRVHMVGGEAPKEMVTMRHTNLNPIEKLQPGTYGSPEEVSEWVRKNVAPRLAKKYRKGSFGLDVMRVEKPGGGHGYKLVELNPSTPEGASGFMDPTVSEGFSPATAMSRWLRGHDPHAVAAMKALGAGGAAAGLAGGGAALAGSQT